MVDPKNWQGEPKKVRKDWREDPFVPSGANVSVKDYAKEITQGKIGVKSMASYKNVAANEVMVGRSFYLSNTLPAYMRDEIPGAWERLEDQVVAWSGTKGRLVVISGPIYANNAPLGWTGVKSKKRREEGRGSIAIPSHFFKVIVDEKTRQGIAFIIPNDDASSDKLPSLAKKISDVERVSGIVLFPGLGEEERKRLTDTVNPSLWPIK